jgi:hypothetical protein
MKKKKERAPTLEELQAELDEAVAQLSEAFIHESDPEVSSLTAAVRACEQAITDAYYRRWGTP